MDEAKIASKIVADYGDVEIFINTFDVFDTNVRDLGPHSLGNVRRDLTPAAMEMLKGKVLKAALMATRNLKNDVISILRRDVELTEDMQDLGIQFKR